MQTEEEKFRKYLSSLKKKSGESFYKLQTIKAYVNSINPIIKDLNYYFDLKLTSLYDIGDTKELVRYHNKLFDIPIIIESEGNTHNRKGSGFRRYIEFREDEDNKQILIVKENQPILEDQEYMIEGGKKIVVSIIAERDLKLRKDAIKIHGLICHACGFDFKKTYGEEFIEIHHIQQLRNEEEFVLRNTNPKTDLIPLCSNCHRMVHKKKNAVLSIAELKEILKKYNLNK